MQNISTQTEQYAQFGCQNGHSWMAPQSDRNGCPQCRVNDEQELKHDTQLAKIIAKEVAKILKPLLEK